MKSRIEQRTAIREKQITKWSKLEAEVTVEQNKNIARGTTDPGYCLVNLSYLSS